MASPLLRQCCLRRAPTLLSPCSYQVSPCATKFWEPNMKSGYGESRRRPVRDVLKENVLKIRPELQKYGEELKEKFRCDSVYMQEAGDYEVFWKFDNTETIDSWIVTTDSDHREGQSQADFALSRNKTGIFQGNLNTTPPKDGIIKQSGYCNIRSPANFKSFERQISYDWSHYTHLLIRYRGDGRPYQLIIAMNRYYDIQWNDQYNYPLFTRGGPYWQIAKIPFSKFFMTAKGRIQDKQMTILDQLTAVRYFAITMGDGAAGSFNLEIDYIALVYDPSHREEFAYEMYKVSPVVHD